MIHSLAAVTMRHPPVRLIECVTGEGSLCLCVCACKVGKRKVEGGREGGFSQKMRLKGGGIGGLRERVSVLFFALLPSLVLLSVVLSTRKKA